MEKVINNICIKLKEFIFNISLRKKIYTNLINLVDGNGTKRIVDTAIQLKMI